VIPDDASVSAKHCQIVESKCMFYMFDLQSRNGTYVNGEKIHQKQVMDKDKIGIGKTILVFHKSALQYTSDEKVL
jgi:pSer/pThr/pTyr-binding forkhead associated (FHA) protein